jgi:hypothetical protein
MYDITFVVQSKRVSTDQSLLTLFINFKVMSKITEISQNQNNEVLLKFQFKGSYTDQGSNYFQNQTTNLLIKVCARLEYTALKPRVYLMSKTNDGKFVFLSSMYPMQLENNYKVEIQRKYFSVFYSGATFNVVEL